MTIWYPATAAKEDSGDDMNNDTQYANNVPTTLYTRRTTYYIYRDIISEIHHSKEGNHTKKPRPWN
jgi:hypothetical protein